MPYKTPEQRRFMHTVYAMQKGKMPKSGDAGKAAEEMHPQDVKDFLMQECGLQECGVSAKQRILRVLKNMKGHNVVSVTEGFQFGLNDPKSNAPVSAVHSLVGRVANNVLNGQISPEDATAYVQKKNVGNEEYALWALNTILQRLIDKKSKLKEIEEPAAPTVVASTKTLHGDFDQTLKMYGGIPFTPKENQAILSFDQAKPVLHTNLEVHFVKSNSFTQNSKIVVRKLSKPQTGQYMYLALIKVRGGEDETEQSPAGEAPPQGGEMVKEGAGDEIKLIESIPIDGQGGEEILTNFLQAVYHDQA